jgi:sugar (pentulose or hexulose) kinase
LRGRSFAFFFGFVPHDVSTVLQGAKTAIRQAVQSVHVSDIKALAVSGQQHGLVALDEEGNVRFQTAVSTIQQLASLASATFVRRIS